MTEIDTRLAAYLIWGVGTVLCYGTVLVRVVGRYNRFSSQRNRKELLSALALFITSLGAFLAITTVLWVPQGAGFRGFLTATALGAFFAAGLLMALDSREVK